MTRPTCAKCATRVDIYHYNDGHRRVLCGWVSASQTVFSALPNYNALLVGRRHCVAAFVYLHAVALTCAPLGNRWLNIQEFHPSRTLHAYSEQISNILDMQRLANVAVGLHH